MRVRHRSKGKLDEVNTPYLFNSKELDLESGFYYYGARYYNPRESLWLSVDPLADYNPVMNDEHYIDGEHNGGVFNSFNGASYGYCYQNPVALIDPNGKQVYFMTPPKERISAEQANALVDITPGVGDVKGLGESIVGYNILGQKLSTTDRFLGLALLSEVRSGKTVFKTLNSVNHITKAGSLAEKTLKQTYKLRGALGLVAKDGMQAHHLIPVELLKKNKVVQDAVEAGFDFNGKVNGLAVKGSHGPHANYTESIRKRIDDWKEANPEYTPKQAKAFMEKIADQAKQKIQKNGGDVKKTEL